MISRFMVASPALCYDLAMRTLLALIVIAAACGGPQPKKESSMVPEGSDTSDHCCCKTNPLTSEDNKPVFEMSGRMDCSSKHGECVPDVQCSINARPGAGSGSAE
jgi:hypothetical protein